MAPATVRTMRVTLCPSEALCALATLSPDRGNTVGCDALSPRFHRELAREFKRHTDALDSLARCIEWLARRGIARVVRPRARGGVRTPTWLCPVELRADLTALARAAGEDAPEGASRTSALAIRVVLHAVADHGMLVARAVRGGGGTVKLDEVIAALDAALSTAGVSIRGPLPPVLRRVGQPGAVTPVPKPAPVPTKPVAAGFGGLPDDAQPEDLRRGETLSSRGLTPDAEFFLLEAGISQWPCSATELERSRRALMARLHPDRAGEASVVCFHRVVRGHEELARKVPSPIAPTAPAVVVTPRTTVREWPPPNDTPVSVRIVAR